MNSMSIEKNTPHKEENLVLIFTKYPHPGFAKTRLIPAVGADQAATISRRLSERCFRTVSSFCAASGAIPIVYFADPTEGNDRKLIDEWLASQMTGSPQVLPQASGDLGDRLKESFLASFRGTAEGSGKKTVVVGVDIPEIDAGILSSAFKALDSSDVVVGPALDGGYYLLGLRAPNIGVFDDVTWGSEHVFEETIQNCEKLGLSYSLLKKLQDVDLPGDLPYFYNICR